MTYKSMLPHIFPHVTMISRLILQELTDRFNDTDEYTRVDGKLEQSHNGSSFAVTADAPRGFVNVYMSETSWQKWLIYDRELIETTRRRAEMEAAHAEHMRKVYEKWGHLLP